MSALLTLEVISQNGATLGAARRKTFGTEGGRIGRAPDCEWVLVNPYISRHHATVGYQGGRFYIESTGENGVAVNSATAMLGRQERCPLRPGDHLFIDDFEVVVSLDARAGEGAAPAGAAGPGAGFLDDVLPPGVASSGNPLPRSYEAFGGVELDPLRQLPATTPNAVSRRPRAAAIPDESWNHSSALSDSFSAPAVANPAPFAPAAGAGHVPGPAMIPEDWDKTNFGRQSPQSTKAPAVQWPTVASPAPLIPTSNPTLPPQSRPAPPPAAPPAAARGVPQWPASRAPEVAGPAPIRPRAFAPPVPPSPTSTPTPTPSYVPSTPVAGATRVPAPPVAAGETPTGSLDLASLLAQAGVDPSQVPPETAAMLGSILRLVVEGTIDVLRARGDIKSEFGLEVTRLKTSENNPLKFSANAEDALGSLLQRRNPAYLPPVEAFRDAYDDIRAHQMAMLAGMRAGFEHVLSRFDPAQLQPEFDRLGKRGGLLAKSARSRYWEMFEEHFHELTADRERAFRKLFGEDFAKAYELQLEAVKRSGRRPRR